MTVERPDSATLVCVNGPWDGMPITVGPGVAWFLMGDPDAPEDDPRPIEGWGYQRRRLSPAVEIFEWTPR